MLQAFSSRLPPTTYYGTTLLLATCNLLLTTHYSLLTTRYLLEQTTLEHLAAAHVDALAQRHAWRGEEEGTHVERGTEGVELLVGAQVLSSR